MQRQLEEFNRSVTIIIWYKVRYRFAPTGLTPDAGTQLLCDILSPYTAIPIISSYFEPLMSLSMCTDAANLGQYGADKTPAIFANISLLPAGDIRPSDHRLGALRNVVFRYIYPDLGTMGTAYYSDSAPR